MRRFVPWIVAVVLFWPLVMVFLLGYRWSGEVVRFLSPTSATQSPASPLPPVGPSPPAPPVLVAQPQPPPSHQSHPSRPGPLTEKDLERLDREFLNHEVRR